MLGVSEPGLRASSSGFPFQTPAPEGPGPWRYELPELAAVTSQAFYTL